MFVNVEYYFSKMIKKLRLKAVKDSVVDKTAHIASGCQVQGSTIGKYTAISYDCQIVNCGIGAFCSFGSGIIIGGASHPMEWASMSQVFIDEKNSIKKKYAREEYYPFVYTKIGNDVWIGDRALIKAGVTIGDGAVIGMGSVVTKDVGPYEIWAGNPAKYIRNRFPDDIVEDFKRISLDGLSDSELEYLAKFIKDPQRFVDSYEELRRKKHEDIAHR